MWPIKRDSQRIPAFKQTNLMRSPHLSREMKPIFALFIVFSLLLVADLSYARKDVGEYWKNMMNGQHMPEAIKDLLVQDPQVSDAGKKDHFVRDFDIKPNIILYHTHVESKQQKQEQKASVKNYEPKFHGTGRHG